MAPDSFGWLLLLIGVGVVAGGVILYTVLGLLPELLAESFVWIVEMLADDTPEESARRVQLSAAAMGKEARS